MLACISPALQARTVTKNNVFACDKRIRRRAVVNASIDAALYLLEMAFRPFFIINSLFSNSNWNCKDMNAIKKNFFLRHVVIKPVKRC